MSKRVVVVGSGAGGLVAAAYLAKDGYEVTVLERAPKPGGLLAGFRRGEYGFDPGVHYVGECGPNGLLTRTLEPLGLDTKRLFVPLDPDGFDVYRFPDLEVRVPADLHRYRERLAAVFPDHDVDICDVLSLVGAARDMMHLGTGESHVSTILLNLPSLLRWARASYGELLDDLVSSPRLRAVLSAPMGDEGLPPSRASALSTLALMAHYADGAFYPRGGSQCLRDALVTRARELGVHFACDAHVTRVTTKGGRASGVEVAGGHVHEADYVVSAIDPRVTFGMVDGGAPPRRYGKKLALAESSPAPFLLLLGMRRDLAARGLGRANVWSYPDFDVEEAYAAAARGELRDDPGLFLSPTSLKDDSGTLAAPGTSTLEIMTFVPWSHFSRFADRREGERGPEYAALKERVTQSMLAAMERRFPGLVGDVEVCESLSPLSFRSWVGAVDGGAYGPASTPSFWGPMRFGTTTWLPNLVLAGAGVNGHGVAPCMLSGRLAAGAIARAAETPTAAWPRLQPP